MLKNKSFKMCAAVCLLITALASAGAFLFSPVSGAFTLCACLLLDAAFFIYTKSRFTKLQALSDYLTSLVNGAEALSVPEQEEGELSILQNNIYKTAKKLQTQTELLYKDKNYLSDSLADISHQMKTPITSMMLMTDLLRNENLSKEKQREFLENINTQLEKMQWMIITLLKISKFDAGTAVLKKEPVALNAVITQAIKPFLISAELQGITIDAQCGEMYFEGDLAWTVEAVQNIIKNCMEHMHKGGTLKITGEQTVLYTALHIQDDGSGIEKEDLPHIFERFYKGKNASPDSVGIGLALSKSVFNRENAIIDVTSTAGKGTAFCVKFYKSII